MRVIPAPICSPGFNFLFFYECRNHFIRSRFELQSTRFTVRYSRMPDSDNYLTFISRKSPKSLWLVENSSDQP